MFAAIGLAWRNMLSSPRASRWLLVLATGALALAGGNSALAVTTTVCTGGAIPPQIHLVGGNGPSQPDLVVKGPCTMTTGSYHYGAVNIIQGDPDPVTRIRPNGSITFLEPKLPAGSKPDIDFWASSIIIENGGSMIAGADAPFGTNGGTLTITLYGADPSKGDPMTNPAQGALCITPEDLTNAVVSKRTGPCGIPLTTWLDNGANKITSPPLPGGATSDWFYQYGNLMGDTKKDSTTAQPTISEYGFFGNKMLALSYGGTLYLRGLKGTKGAAAADGNPDAKPPIPPIPASSGTSWVRLASNLTPPSTTPKPGDTQTMTLEPSVAGDWQVGDKVVITTTDYIPAHSEERTITAVNGATVTFSPPVDFPHNGARYPLKSKLGAGLARLGFDPTLTNVGAETRAAAALLSRSIRIVSGGDTDDKPFPAACVPPLSPPDTCPPPYYFGGQVIFRQGFAKLQIQGVEFKQLGEGGRMGRYAVHFHKARNPPDKTYIKDSSVNESMTRWIVLHSTNGVTLARNVGYKSIGHGYYLEDGTETENKFYANIGIDARAAVYSGDNPRRVPGILAANNQAGDAFPQISDVNHPSVFWITNGWNDFIGNMAVGAGTCGSCYWFIASTNNDMADVGPTPMDPPKYVPNRMKWTGYSALQERIGPGTTPLKSFYMNYCSSAMNSFITVKDTAACNGMAMASPTPVPDRVTAIRSVAPNFDPGKAVSLMYYPTFTDLHFPTACDPNSETSETSCSKVNICAFGNPATCGVAVLDHYTSSFNWADFNFSALWLRSGWYLLDNSVVTDVQNAGLTFVSGGDYLRGSVPEGYWAVASHVAFVGETQPGGKFTSAKGPFNNGVSGLKCVDITQACVNTDLGLPMQLSNFGVNQRLFNIYDGPTYEDSNAFLDIKTTSCTDAATCMYWNTQGVRKNPQGSSAGTGYLPNAGIAWKQSNGFYYPPAFHSRNLFFNNVEIRHYVIEPFFLPGTYLSNQTMVQENYTGKIPNPFFSNWTDIDRQTELNDDDGTLTGLAGTFAPLNQTISVNKDSFFNAPIETDQCRSNLGVDPSAACTGVTKTRATAKTSPYDYLTTVVYPECALGSQLPGQCGSYKGAPVFTEVVDPDHPCDSKYPEKGCVRYTRYTEKPDQGGIWSKGCGGPYCFGVPIYRQFLVGTDTAGNETKEWKTWATNNCSTTGKGSTNCQFPFARMAGTGDYQRSVMTLNGGTYYIDTTVSQLTQRKSEALGLTTDKATNYVECAFKTVGNCEPRSVNVFQGGKKYYVFFVYAKDTTQQTYQIYVGTGFNPATDVEMIQMRIDPPFKPNEGTLSWPATWSRKMIAGPDGKLDVLQVTVNMSSFKTVLDPRDSSNGTCKPASFCKSDCTCNLKPTDPRVIANPNLMRTCTATCSTWARKDLDCPKDGCLGFSFKLPQSGFAANDTYHRPKPLPFPSTGPIGTAIKLVTTKFPPDDKTPSADYKASSCFYPKVPGTTEGCPVPYVP